MKILLISDTHGLHKAVEAKGFPEADMIIHAGDVSNVGTLRGLQEFVQWYTSLNYRYKIFIGGNHDFGLQKSPNIYDMMTPNNMNFLNDSHVTIDGIKIYGAPYTPTFLNWAYMKDRGTELKEYWDKVPADTDILVSHGPPHNILDYVEGDPYGNKWEAQHCGCLDQLNMLRKLKLPLNVFGHIHEDYGTKKVGKTQFINASSLDGRYVVRDKPYTLIDFNNKTKEVKLL